MSNKLTFIDLFAGGGGLSEGFLRRKFDAIAHVEMNNYAAETLSTRIAFYFLSKTENLKYYYSYLKKEITRDALLKMVPQELKDSIINEEISKDNLKKIFLKIDNQLDGRKLDVIIGGPPCQAYSIVGRSRDPNYMKGDKRNFLFRNYADFLVKYKPKFFVFENVLGLLTAGNAEYFNEMLKLFSEIGYSTDFRILKAEDYGVLQKRRRVVIIGRKGKLKFHFPHLETINNTWQIKKDLLYDLPPLNAGEGFDIAGYTKPINEYLGKSNIRNGIDYTTQHTARNHNERDLEIYSIAINKWINEKKRLKYTELPKRLQTHNNVLSFLDRYKVVDPFGYSHTMVAHIAKDGHYYIYPNLNQIRSLSVREAARIQSFPDNYYFEGGRKEAFKQIGNAVPPLMAEKIATSLENLLNNE